MLPWDLEDWITDVGADILDKRCANPQSLSPIDGLIYEIWLLDTEARNGGLSQYFSNHGLAQWKSCCAAVSLLGLNSFSSFEVEVNSMISGAADPYREINARGDMAENLWYLHQCKVVKELQSLAENSL